MRIMFVYPKVLNRKELKRISKYSCDEQIKEAYLKYLTNYSFREFAGFSQDNSQMDLEDIIFSFTDSQLEKFKPNSLLWISHVMVNFLIYFDVNLDYGKYYDAYASALQFTVFYWAMVVAVDKVSFEVLSFPEHSAICFEKFFTKCPDFEYDLKKDCDLAYKSFNNDFGFSSEEFYVKVKSHFDEKNH